MSVALDLSTIVDSGPLDFAHPDMTRIDETPGSLGYFDCTNSPYSNHQSTFTTLTRVTPPTYPYFVDAVEFLAYYTSFSNSDVTIPQHSVTAWAGAHSEATPDATPVPTISFMTPTTTEPGCGVGTCTFAGSALVHVALPTTLVINSDQDLFITIDNPNNIAACMGSAPAGGNYYAASLTAPFTWMANPDGYAPGLRAYGHASSSLNCPSATPTACPNATAPVYCTATTCN